MRHSRSPPPARGVGRCPVWCRHLPCPEAWQELLMLTPWHPAALRHSAGAALAQDVFHLGQLVPDGKHMQKRGSGDARVTCTEGTSKIFYSERPGFHTFPLGPDFARPFLCTKRGQVGKFHLQGKSPWISKKAHPDDCLTVTTRWEAMPEGQGRNSARCWKAQRHLLAVRL